MNYNLLNIIIASIWIINGLVCKILNLVPRHEQIVAQILDTSHSRLITIIIGFMEIGMAFWILSGYRQKLNTITQIIIIGGMNIIEFVLVPNLLLWGKLNAVFAFILIVTIYYNGFHSNKKNHDTI